jgi:L-iditol 2-dehydrogenase
MASRHASRRRTVLPTAMRAVVLHGQHDLRVEEVPVPRLGPWDALIRVRACGICASDIHYLEHGRIGRYTVEQPLILGHEVAGDVVALGSDVAGPAIGTRVAVEPGATCGRCAMCKAGRYNLCPDVRFFATPPVHGAMAEYAVIRADLAWPIPASVTYEQATLCEPISVGIHCANLTGVRPGDTVVVLGAGPIGLMAIVAARQRGAAQVIASDVFPRRLEVAGSLGAVPVDVRSEDLAAIVKDRTGGRGADALFDTSGVRSVTEAAPGLLCKGGAIAIVGLPADDNVTYHMLDIVDKELSIHGVFRYANTYRAAVALVASGRYPVEQIVTDRVPIEDAVAAFDRALNEKATTIKSIVTI